jgi:hypothetical protein
MILTTRRVNPTGRSSAVGEYQTNGGRNAEESFETLGVVPARLSGLSVFGEGGGSGSTLCYLVLRRFLCFILMMLSLRGPYTTAGSVNHFSSFSKSSFRMFSNIFLSKELRRPEKSDYARQHVDRGWFRRLRSGNNKTEHDQELGTVCRATSRPLSIRDFS